MLKPTILISTLLLLQTAFAADTKLNVDKTSGKIEYQISEILPKGDYKIWNVTKDTDVGIEIHKKSANDASGKITINKNALDDKFAILDADGFTVFPVESEISKQTVVVPVVDKAIALEQKKAVAIEPVKEVAKVEVKEPVKEVEKEIVKEEPQIVPEISTAPTILEEAPMDSLAGDDETVTSPSIVQMKTENETQITDTEMPSKKN
ncbi:MAG: hypothetical protein H7177_15315 [Rhizobacter sp.]|nr:hypothetical protein [Bacteriovorax sp.]